MKPGADLDITPPILEIHDLVVRREGHVVLNVEHLSMEAGEVLAVIGPNGAGKSTLLLVIARLQAPDQGQFFFRGQPVASMSGLSYRRRIGLVLQEPLLLDCSVFDNVAAALRYRRLPRKQVSQRVDEWLGRLGVNHLAYRPARRLSGGEAQRVSLARAFALEPELLLLDEPFSSLDTPTRLKLLEDLHTLLGTTSTTTVFVTHDQDEALSLGDRVAVLLGGRLRQEGSPQSVFTAPVDGEVASFVGIETVIAGQVIACQQGCVTVQAQGKSLQAVGEVPVGRSVLLCLRPEDVTLSPGEDLPASSARNRLRGNIQRITPQGALVRLVVDCGFPVVALITRASHQEMGLSEGQVVSATFKASAIHLIQR